jgi:hypothetical protein
MYARDGYTSSCATGIERGLEAAPV